MTPGFEDLFERLVDSPDHYRPDGDRASRFFSPYLHALRDGNQKFIGYLRDYVRGDHIASDLVNPVLSYLGWKREAHAADVGLPHLRPHVRGHRRDPGLLVRRRRDARAGAPVRRGRAGRGIEPTTTSTYAFEVLKHYVAVTMKRDDLAFDPEALYRGGHGVHQALPLRFEESQPLASILALTPLEEIRDQFASLTSSTAYDVHLAPLEPGLLPELVDRIAALYERAYAGHEVSRVARDAGCRRIAEAYDGGHDSFRDAVRATVFLLDADRLPRARGRGRDDRRPPPAARHFRTLVRTLSGADGGAAARHPADPGRARRADVLADRQRQDRGLRRTRGRARAAARGRERSRSSSWRRRAP